MSTEDIGTNQPPITQKKIDEMQKAFNALGIFRTGKGDICGKWFVRKEGDRACWYALGKSCAQQVRAIVEIMTKFGRDVHINTGGHGSEYGLNPTSAGMGEGDFAMEDFQIA